MDYKNQHWIPKSYLKAWCDPVCQDKVVHVYGTDGRYLCWRPYSKIFSTDELYTVIDGRARDIETEKKFKTIEDEFLKVRKAIECEEPLPADTKTLLAWYVAATRNRSPSARDHWQSFKDRVVEIGDGMAQDLAKASPAKRRVMAVPLMLRKFGASSSMPLEEARLEATEPFGKWVLRHVAIEARLLQQMSFSIMKAPHGIGFVTSDNPVVWYDANPPKSGHRNLGLSYQDIEVSMPLTPRHCLLFHHWGEDSTGDLGQSGVDMLNSRTLARCDNCFISNSRELIVDWP
jgi:hypothetical protein